MQAKGQNYIITYTLAVKNYHYLYPMNLQFLAGLKTHLLEWNRNLLT